MSELNDVKVGDWLIIVSTIKGASFILQRVISVTTGLVKTQNYTFFRRDGRSFSVKQKSLIARSATDEEIEQWLSRQRKQATKGQSKEDEQTEVVLARYLATVSAEEWARLGLAQLKKIKAVLEKSSGR